MRRNQEPGRGADELEQLLTERGSQLMGIAIALTGGRADAEDLLQAALERLVRKPAGRDHRPRGVPAAHAVQPGG